MKVKNTRFTRVRIFLIGFIVGGISMFGGLLLLACGDGTCFHPDYREIRAVMETYYLEINVAKQTGDMSSLDPVVSDHFLLLNENRCEADRCKDLTAFVLGTGMDIESITDDLVRVKVWHRPARTAEDEQVTKYTTQTYTLVKEEDRWKVHMDYSLIEFGGCTGID